jgi:cytochrome c
LERSLRQARRASAAALVVLAFALTACGNGDDEAALPATDDVAAVDAPVPEIAVPPQANSPGSPPAAEIPAEPVPAAEPADEAPIPPEPIAAPDAEPVAAPLLAVEDDPAVAVRVAAGDPDAGWRFAQRCVSCHSLAVEGPGPGGPQLGPPLAGIVDAPIAAAADFDYSAALAEIGAAGATWSAALLDAFLASPSDMVPGTTMAFGGIADGGDRADVIAYLLDLAAQREAAVPAAAVRDFADRVAEADPALGETLAAASCGGCHGFGEGGPAVVGPSLFDVVGRPVGDAEGFAYSPAFRAMNGRGTIWTYDALDAFLENPALAVPGTRMGFSGIRNADDRAAIVAYLRQLSADPFPLAIAIGVPDPDMTPVAYAAEQAERGEALYADHGCDNCHGADLGGDIDISGFGDAPALAGAGFQRRWFGRDLGALFALLRDDKEEDLAGALPGAIVDLMALILRENGFRAGAAALPAEPRAMAEMGFFQ